MEISWSRGFDVGTATMFEVTARIVKRVVNENIMIAFFLGPQFMTAFIVPLISRVFKGDW